LSASSYTIRSYKPGDEARILELLNEVFAEDNPAYVPRTMEQWRWEYQRNPCGHEIVVAEEAGGRIVGHYACVPSRAKLRDRIVQCGQGVDSMVSREYRAGLKSEGLFLKTARYYFETHGLPAKNAFGYGFPNKRALRVGVRMLAYQPVFAPVRALGRNLFQHRDDADLPGYGDPGTDIVGLDRMDERADRLWERVAVGVRLGIVRDACYLNWRYVDCPYANYLAFGLVDATGDLRGLYVARENWTGPPIFALTEFLVPQDEEPATTRRLLNHAVAEARARRQQRVELWCRPGSRVFQQVASHGFVAENSPFNLCIKPYEEGLDLDWVKDNWHFSIGDTDVF